jgi:hypothetical protein
MTRSRDGEELLRDALVRRRRHWPLADLAQSLSAPVTSLNNFADGIGALPEHVLCALSQIMFRSEFDPTTRTISSRKRA